jgi:hypothetical protein
MQQGSSSAKKRCDSSADDEEAMEFDFKEGNTNNSK